MKPLQYFLSFAACTILSSCYAVSRGTHVIVGAQRPPVAPESVKIYYRPPAKFEVIALVSAKGHTDPMFPANDQALMDAAIFRLKREAAALGANGVLLSGVGEQQAGASRSMVDTSSNLNASNRNVSLDSVINTNFTVDTPTYDKIANGRAIHVLRE